jgi:hypothetical protein
MQLTQMQRAVFGFMVDRLPMTSRDISNGT